MYWKMKLLSVSMASFLTTSIPAGYVSAEGALVEVKQDVKLNTGDEEAQISVTYLFLEHLDLTIDLMKKHAKSADLEADIHALKQNASSLASAVGLIYGQNAKKEFQKIWGEQIDLCVDAIKNIDRNDQDWKKMVEPRFIQYQKELFDFFLSRNPQSKDNIMRGLNTHADFLMKALERYKKKDYEAAYKNLSEAYRCLFDTEDVNFGKIFWHFTKKINGSAESNSLPFRASFEREFLVHANLLVLFMQSEANDSIRTPFPNG
ncbi:hypothetical protein [Effusibacillus dendaii]|uniref:Uncharacterized protein n=1 Tax=Effusibacillus dendaii TaxID=2743772 RepID=A0A7I8D5U9_9BACL|nr:hypothetical protein [Effusibacillus dendaii]BCJ85528.1 hypothetical protein skT53_05130 [Effusibacillus dendaii]